MMLPEEPEIRQPLLRTKITIPPLPPDCIHRPRLTARVDQGVKGSLTLLAAPAGFGKTHLLIEWAANKKRSHKPCSIAWLTVHRGDDDLTHFFRYLVGALQEVNPQLGTEMLDFIHAAKRSGLEIGLTLLLNEISALPDDIVLVLDDFHFVEDASIYHSLDFLLEHIPHNLHLVIASRREPALEIALLRTKGQVTELGADALRFTREEIAQFFHSKTGIQLPPETVLALETHSEGWVTALQLAAIALPNQPDPLALLINFQGDAHYLADFLAEEVLNRQPEDVQQFLLRSSILDVLSGVLCEAVINPDAQPGYGSRMLDQLEHANLFLTSLDRRREWFRYHPLFADFLRHVLIKTNPVEVPMLQKRAARWFEERSNLDQAFRYALEAGDGEWAAALIERHIQTMVKTGEVFSLTHWIGKLPGEVVHLHPALSLAYAWGSIAAYQLDTARYWLDDLQQSIEYANEQFSLADPSDSPESKSWNLYGGLAVCRSTLALMSGEIQQAEEYSKEAAKYLKENPFIQSFLSLEHGLYFTLTGDTLKAIEVLRDAVRIARLANNLFALVAAYSKLAEMQALQGHLSQALVTLQKAQLAALGPDGKALPLSGIIDIEIGEILRERNLLDEAKEYLQRGIRLTKPWWILSAVDGIMALARLLQSQGDIEGSYSLVNEGFQLALSTETSRWDDVYASAFATRMALQRNDLAAAIQCWQGSGLGERAQKNGDISCPYQVDEYLQLTRARFYLALGQDSGDIGHLHQALETLNSILPQAERYGRFTIRLEVLALQALVQQALGDLDEATKTLLMALALGEPEGYRRVFLDEGSPMANLLARCLQAQHELHVYTPSPPYIEELLAAFCQAEAGSRATAARQFESVTAKTEDGLLVSLSARELQVLSLIAAGKSNQEISDQLFLALNTVKRHTYNIFLKLDVKKRTQAVSKARQLGLIP
ncbi:MAG TPA: LuxR C-terminal-related transcriptional regulator [Anaerolineales bacterium]|nr:LuxR C-terminal-related transcriptional regulator [Anaerolineales bacterium]